MAPTEPQLPRERFASGDNDARQKQFSAWLEGEQVTPAKKSAPAPSEASYASIGMKLSLSLIAAVVIAGAIMLFEPIWHMIGPVEAIGQD